MKHLPKKALLKDKKFDEKAFYKQWIKEERNFLESLNTLSRKELIELSHEHWGMHKSYKMQCEHNEKIIENLNSIFALTERSNKDNRSLLEESLSAMKVGIKRIEYLENILGQRNNERAKKRLVLVKGRESSNQKRSMASQNLERKLKQAIEDYIKAHPDHKVSNKELEGYLGKQGFIGSDTYSGTTFKKKVAKLAADIRKESHGQ